MAQFCARVRKRDDLPSVSMKDVYQHPTIQQPGRGARGRPHPTPCSPPGAATPAPGCRPRLRRGGDAGQHRGSTSSAGRCSCWSSSATPFSPRLVTVGIFDWISAGSGVVDVYLRSVVAGGALFVGLCTLPILAKWVLIGRWKPRQFRVWSLAYVRFWIVKTLVQRNPLVLLFVGFAAVLAVPAGAGREDRPGRRDPLPERAGVHRPAHHRRRHGDPQGLVPQRLPGPRTA